MGSLIRLEVTVKFAGHSSLKQGWQSVTLEWEEEIHAGAQAVALAGGNSAMEEENVCGCLLTPSSPELPARCRRLGSSGSGWAGDEGMCSWRAAGVPHPRSTLPGLFVLLGP